MVTWYVVTLGVREMSRAVCRSNRNRKLISVVVFPRLRARLVEETTLGVVELR